jgi:hypothetical protein
MKAIFVYLAMTLVIYPYFIIMMFMDFIHRLRRDKKSKDLE